MKKLVNTLHELQLQTPHIAKQKLSVSSSNVAWHIHHSLKALTGISNALTTVKPTAYKWQFNIRRLFILGIGTIPRGKVKTPKSITVEEEITLDMIDLQFKKANQVLANLNSLPKDSYFVHPILGSLNLKQTQLFMQIHTNHHLKIIKDIIYL